MPLDQMIADLRTRRLEHLARYAAAGIIPEQWSHKTWDNVIWVFADCNDLGVPYFHKLRRKTLYTVYAAAESIRQHVISYTSKGSI